VSAFLKPEKTLLLPTKAIVTAASKPKFHRLGSHVDLVCFDGFVSRHDSTNDSTGTIVQYPHLKYSGAKRAETRADLIGGHHGISVFSLFTCS
jgi:di/tripeptidase